MRSDEISCQKPLAQRQMSAVHHRPGDERGLMVASRPGSLSALFNPNTLALPDPRSSFKPPGAVPAALRTFEAAAPAFLRQILGAGEIVGEVRCELLQRWRPILGPASWKQAFAHPARIAEQGRHVMRER